jgi:DNA-binding transcriptional LysR family regulator
MDLNEIVVFARVVQAGSFTAAARVLGMPKSSVSRKVTALEDRVGARLLQRTTRKLGLTDAGRSYYTHAARIVGDLEEAEQAIGRLHAEPQGLVRVTAPLGFTMLGPIVAEYLAANPKVKLELVCSDRRVDLVEEGFDLAIRASALADSSLVARPLGTIRLVLVAAPSYCDRAGTPRAPADLRKHVCLSFGTGAQHAWSLQRRDEKLEVRVEPRFVVNDIDLLAAATRTGLGIACMPDFLCAADLARGTLRAVLPAWHSAPTPVTALYPTSRHLSPKVSAFIELLRKRITLSR